VTVAHHSQRTLRRVAKELEALDADWAVGGAVAMAAHGYTRETADVDLFIGDDVREELLARLAADDSLDLIELMEPFHYGVVEKGAATDARLDLLFPSLGIESLAVMAADRAPVFGESMPVWPLHHIVAAKLVTDPRVDPARAAKDAQDLRELRDRGLIDAARVHELLEDVGDRGARRRLRELTAPARKKPLRRSRP
jgi:hypothetical protein